MKILPRLLFLLMFAGLARAQSGPDTLWTRRFDWIPQNQDQTNFPDQIRIEPDGNLISGAIASGELHDRVGERFYIKLNLSGDTLWSQLCSGLDPAPIERCVQCGYREYRWEEALRIRWEEWVSEGPSDTLTYRSEQVARAADNGWYIAGFARDAEGYLPAIQFLMKTDIDGNEEWLYRFDEHEIPGNVRIHKLFATPDGGVITVGSVSTDKARRDRDFAMIRFFASGDTVWTWHDGLDLQDYIDDAILLSDESVIAVTYKSLVKVTNRGKTEWLKPTNKFWINSKPKLCPVNDGFLITDIRTEKRTGRWAEIVQLDLSGNVVWIGSYNAEKYSVFTAAAQLPDGGYLLGGIWNGGIGLVRLAPYSVK